MEKYELSELRDCEVMQSLNSHHRKIIEWTIEQYLDIERQSNQTVPIEIWDIATLKDEPAIFSNQRDYKVNRRKLENLDALDFDFGIRFCFNHFMPFFTHEDIGLFKKTSSEIGDICILKIKIMNNYWIGFREETGYFDLEGNYLGTEEEIEEKAILVNIEVN